FIYLSLFFIIFSILFINKPNKSLYFYINYQALNTIIIKDYYLLSLVKKTLNNLKKIYYFIKINI
ncbi:hypothetical protein P170DRAFT_322855, partial [Aspergillus steynii IBT 23096]